MVGGGGVGSSSSSETSNSSMSIGSAAVVRRQEGLYGEGCSMLRQIIKLLYDNSTSEDKNNSTLVINIFYLLSKISI